MGVQDEVLRTAAAKAAAPKISVAELERMLLDPDVPDSQLRPYLRQSTSESTAFHPVVEIDPEKVIEPQTESALALSSLNGIDRRRRQRRYRDKIRNWDGLRIVSEGDSWFQYPFLIDDVIDHLFDEFAIFSLDAAGDLLGDMIRQDELSAAIAAEKPDVVLISGGGNDLLGDGRLRSYLHSYQPGRPVDQYLKPNFDTFLAGILDLYRQVMDRAAAHGVKRIVCHTYAFAIPNGGRWLGGPMELLGISSNVLQRQIVRHIVNRFHKGLTGLAALPQFQGRLFVADCRDVVPDDLWYDELHPDSRGFRIVAKRIRELILSPGGAAHIAVEATSENAVSPVDALEAASEDLLVYSEDVLLAELGRRVALLKVEPSMAGAYTSPVLMTETESTGSTLFNLGRRVLDRLHRELHGLLCGTSSDEADDRAKLQRAFGLTDAAVAGGIASALIGLSVPPLIAPVVAALLVKHAVMPTWEETCAAWRGALKPDANKT